MTARSKSSFGLVATIILACGLGLLPLMVPGYDWVRQTVSEMGEMHSPARIPFAAMLCCFAGCLLVFASAVRDVSLQLRRSTAAAHVTGFMAISSVGVGIFAYPHPLHNVFGLSEFVGYQAPWVLAFAWRGIPKVRGLIAFSWIMAVVVWCAIIANFGALDPHGWIWTAERPVYGIIQRSLFFAWCVWLAGTSLTLMADRGIAGARPGVVATDSTSASPQ